MKKILIFCLFFIPFCLLAQPCPTITTQPQDARSCTDGIPSFSAVASGTGLTYQWFFGNSMLANGFYYSGVTTPTMRIEDVRLLDSTDVFTLHVSNGCGTTTISNPVKLIIDNPPTTRSPQTDQNVAFCAGNFVTLEGSMLGGTLVYQWYKKAALQVLPDTLLANGAKYEGVKTEFLTVKNLTNSDNGASFYMKASTSPDNTCADSTAQTADYTLLASNPLQCSVLEIAAGLDDEEENDKKSNIFSIYPNPLYGETIYIDGISPKKINQVALYNLSGQMVFCQHHFDSNRLVLPTLAQGLYLLQIQTNRQIYTQKIIKQ